jgi:nucleotide-binding universal stress UspA family protein
MKRVLVYVQELDAKKIRVEIVGQILEWLSCIKDKPRFILLHVIDEALLENAVLSGTQIGTGFMDAETLRKTLVEKSIDRGLEYLNSLKQDFDIHGYRATTLVKIGNPVTTVIQESQFHKTDAILVVERRRSILSTLFGEDSYGGVCEKIIQKSNVPVVVITPKSIRFTDMGKKRSLFPRKWKVPMPNL